jgi:UDPglucose 6-dehydrogenase
MKICVFGLWHLGTVTAACLASRGYAVAGLDFESTVVEQLQSGQPPLFEPDLEDLIQQNLRKGHLSFGTDIVKALDGAEVVWVTYDTPVDDEDRADVDFVVERVVRLFPHLAPGTLVLLSSQLPVGTTRRLEKIYAAAYPGKPVTFGYSPENLRLGKAVNAFAQPDRVVVGVRNPNDRELVGKLFAPFTEHIEWMSVESAEMTKHALNAFLATSVTFINEIAILCERVGADAKDVERGLKSDSRIGQQAYLSPGAPFAGGTLARDILFLELTGRTYHQPTCLISGVRASNEAHKNWARRTLQTTLGDLRGQRVAVWGLTYKPGTDTLRRSASVELCKWMVEQGAQPQVHDPVIKTLPEALVQKCVLHTDPLDALKIAAALLVATEWPVYRSINADSLVAAMPAPLVIDPNRFLSKTMGIDTRIRYVTVGKASI